MLRAWFALTSVRTANALLLALVVAALPGIVVEQFGSATLADPMLTAAAVDRLAGRYGDLLGSVIERLELYRVFTSGWWTVLVALLTVSLAGNTVSRLPRLVRDVRGPSVKRGRAFFRSSIRGRTGPLDGLDGSGLPDLLRADGYHVRTELVGPVTHLLAERNRFAPLGSVVTHVAPLFFVIGMGIVTPRFGYEAALKVPVGETRPTGLPNDPNTVLVENQAFVARFDAANNPLDYRTTLAVYGGGGEIARKEITVNDPLTVAGWTLHQNFFGPAVELDIRDERGAMLYSGSVLLDGNLGGQPEGLVRVPGTDLSLELLLGKGEGDVAELTVVGARQPTGDQVGPQIVFGARLRTGDGYFAADPGIGIEFRKPSSYVGLITKRDPGQGLVWLGAVLLLAGLSISLLLPRRRVWARYNATTVRLAVVGGDPFAEEACERLVRRLPPVADGTGGPVASPGVSPPPRS